MRKLRDGHEAQQRAIQAAIVKKNNAAATIQKVSSSLLSSPLSSPSLSLQRLCVVELLVRIL